VPEVLRSEKRVLEGRHEFEDLVVGYQPELGCLVAHPVELPAVGGGSGQVRVALRYTEIVYKDCSFPRAHYFSRHIHVGEGLQLLFEHLSRESRLVDVASLETAPWLLWSRRWA